MDNSDGRSETETRVETAATERERPTTCPECSDGTVVRRERGERICESCGLVVDGERFDHGPEWRAFTAEERSDRSRVGAPTTNTLHDRGLSARIDWRNRDAFGNPLEPQVRERMQRLRTWDDRYRTRGAKDRNLKQALGEIDRMASALGLPDDVRETASVLYRRALDADLLRGRSIEGVATGALYAATRLLGIPRSLDDLAAVSRVDRVEFSRAYRQLVREFDLVVEPTDPREYVPRLASALDLSDEAERLARELLAAATADGVHSGKNPVGLAAAAIYAAAIVSDEGVTQRTISAVADVSEVTIRNRYTELLAAADIDPR